MKSIRRNFEEVQKRKPRLSSYNQFVLAITGKRLSPKAMKIQFYKLVEKDDYEGSSKKEIMEFLESCLKPVRTEKNRG